MTRADDLETLDRALRDELYCANFSSRLGKMLGVSEPRISQLHSRAMGRLRVMLSEAA